MSRQANVILVMCDDLGYGDVGFNGGTTIQTPHLDAWAKESLCLERFYAGGPVCSPTRGTCLTGRHYIRYGINHANQGRLPTQEITLASLAKGAGYATGHFGKWHLGTLAGDGSDGNRGGKDERLFSPPWHHGFDVCFSTESKVPTWDPMITPDEARPNGSQRWGEPGAPFGTAYWNQAGERVTQGLEGCDSEVIMDRAESFIRHHSQDPFLAVVWFHAPHTPVVAGEAWKALYTDASDEEQHYYGCVSAMDHQMGRLNALLKELGIFKDTLMWFCSDNGPEGKEDLETNGRSRGSTGGLRGRKRSLYEGGVGVPTLVSWPRDLEPGRRSQAFSTLDMLPTCCSAMGIAPPQDRPLDGENILPALREDGERSGFIPYRFLDREAVMFGSPTVAIMEGSWKFLTHGRGFEEHDELYDLSVDRCETQNLAASHGELCDGFHRKLEGFMASCRSSHGGADYGGEKVDMVTEFQELQTWLGGR